VLRVSEELLRVSVLDDAALILLVRGCSQLQELELVQVEVGDPLLKVIATHGRQLQRLRLEQTYVGDTGVAALTRSCTRLTELRIAGCSPHCWMLPAELMFPGEMDAALPAAAAAAVGAAVCAASILPCTTTLLVSHPWAPDSHSPNRCADTP
jgi:hypothetical protein